MPQPEPNSLVIRALHTTQGDGIDVYAFFITGSEVVKIADITRIERDDDGALKGFQRPEIQDHVKGIIEYLNQGEVLFPNAIILAMSPEIRFVASRGTKPKGDQGVAQAGTLTIPVDREGRRVAWIVDGQQRSLALAKANNPAITVPVIGFITDSLAIRREQFILVNKARPLPTRLINELLPETGEILLPRDLHTRKLPSELCGLLNRDPRSPFFSLIRRPSDKSDSNAVITDTAIIKMIRNSINSPLGALAPYKANQGESPDIESMYRILVNYWNAVKMVFPDAWGKAPRYSRLMHSAGIEAMGVLMDKICSPPTGANEDPEMIKRELQRVAPSCRWTRGTWEGLGTKWNEIQSTPRDIKRLQDFLVRAYAVGLRS